jgi:hypothetical protein
MIEIIKGTVDMPVLYSARKYQVDFKNSQWYVIDTHLGRHVFKGEFESVSIACLNLNKKYYRDKQKE